MVSKGASGETADVTVFLESLRPMCFPVGPRLFRLWAAVPFFPGVGEVATLDGVFCPGGDHGGFGDGDACIGGKILSVFLFTSVNGERQGRVNALEESRHVTVDFVLPDVAIAISNVVEKIAHEDVVEAFVGVIEFRVVDGFDGFGDLVDDDTSHVLQCLPVAEVCLVFGFEALAFGGRSAWWDDGIRWRCVCWWNVGGAVAGHESRGSLELAEVSFVVPPWAVDRDEVCAELLLQLSYGFVGGFAVDFRESLVWHECLDGLSSDDHGGRGGV